MLIYAYMMAWGEAHNKSRNTFELAPFDCRKTEKQSITSLADQKGHRKDTGNRVNQLKLFCKYMYMQSMQEKEEVQQWNHAWRSVAITVL